MISRRTVMRSAAGLAALFGLACCRQVESPNPPIDEYWQWQNKPPEEIVPKLMVYAHEGEVTTCERGHPLARLTRTVHVGERASMTDFEFIGDAKFMMSECPTCGGRVAGLGTYYFNGKLRFAKNDRPTKRLV